MIKQLLLRLSVTASIGLSMVSAAHAQSLWSGAMVGDSLAALHNQFPAATPPTHPQVLSAGEVEVLCGPSQPLNGVPSEAHFFMRDGRLSSVQLRTPVLKVGATAANIAFARRLALELTGSGPPPYSCVDNHFAAISRFECRWLRSDVVVHESYLDVAGQAPVFYVAFRRAGDPAFDS